MTKTQTKKKFAQSCQICRLFNGEGCLIFVLSTHFPFQRKLQFQREPRPPSLEKYVFYLSLKSASVCFHSFDFYTLDKKVRRAFVCFHTLCLPELRVFVCFHTFDGSEELVQGEIFNDNKPIRNINMSVDISISIWREEKAMK